MQNIRNIVRGLIDDVRLADPRVRMFLDKSEDWSEYDVDDPRLPFVNKTIMIKTAKKVVVTKTKKGPK